MGDVRFIEHFGLYKFISFLFWLFWLFVLYLPLSGLCFFVCLFWYFLSLLYIGSVTPFFFVSLGNEFSEEVNVLL